MAQAWKTRRKSSSRENENLSLEKIMQKKSFLPENISPICNKNLILDIKLFFIV